MINIYSRQASKSNGFRFLYVKLLKAMVSVFFMSNYGKNICVIKINWTQTFIFVIFPPQNMGKFEALGNLTESCEAVKLGTVKGLIGRARKGFMRKVHRRPWCQD